MKYVNKHKLIDWLIGWLIDDDGAEMYQSIVNQIIK